MRHMDTARKRSRSNGSLREKIGRRSARPRFVICVDNRGYEASLEPGKVYRTLADREASAIHFLRVIDESGEDYLFPSRMFRPNPLSKDVQRQLGFVW